MKIIRKLIVFVLWIADFIVVLMNDCFQYVENLVIHYFFSDDN